MKITEIKTRRLAAPISERLHVSYGTRTQFEWVAVEVQTDEGVSGFGESVGLFQATAETFLQTEIKPIVIGEDPLQIEYLNHRLAHLFQWNNFAAYPVSAFNTALHDLKGKVLQVPLYQLMGGLYREKVTFSGLIHIHDVEEDVDTAVDLVEKQGFQTLKVKVGRDPGQDEERLQAIRQAVGKDVRIRLDANMAWTPRTAVRLIRRWERYDLEYVEQPVPGWDIQGMKEVAGAVSVPLCADESCQSPADALRLAEERACEIFCVYLSESGGLSRMREIVAIADTSGIHCVLGTWGESGVGFAAGLHLAASSRNFGMANDQGYSLLQRDYARPRFEFQQGKVTVPHDPGLGVQPDSSQMNELGVLVGKDRVFDDSAGSRFIPIERKLQV